MAGPPAGTSEWFRTELARWLGQSSHAGSATTSLPGPHRSASPTRRRRTALAPRTSGPAQHPRQPINIHQPANDPPRQALDKVAQPTRRPTAAFT